MSIDFTPFENLPAEPCVICLDLMTEGLAHGVHRYHTICLTAWVNYAGTCPSCRGRVATLDGRPVQDPVHQVAHVVEDLTLPIIPAHPDAHLHQDYYRPRASAQPERPRGPAFHV